ncbi:hypothetical protein BMR1_03g01715 [Babesia microti strain RI]|uniref:Uncharacterized protein n=1 Tax=Babesia microti (strain RI) TaxID=1133968 RepID=A0A0K3AN53_BABMR|nr:hypothetical protein BMR1_03g01715 [Babesia microti strain RI]CTQ40942.1 hypothetical protein BMR1_03g01715 [Babesia microti strain RI]|eukprot:XP_012648953.1 hypothetical protein BMR1_03g01715 [Babesia microti strain RI]
MGRSRSRSCSSRSGSRSMSLSNSIRSRSYSYYSRRDGSRSYSSSESISTSRSRGKYSRPYSRSRSSSYRPRRRSPRHKSKYYDHKSRRQINGRGAHGRRNVRVNGQTRIDNNFNRSRNDQPKIYRGGKYTPNNNYNGKRTLSVKETKIAENKYNSPPFLLKIYSQIGKTFTLEELTNLEQLEKYMSCIHIFGGTNFRDLVNLLKGEKPEYRSMKGIWEFYKFCSGKLVNLSKVHSVRLHQKIDFKSFKDIGLSIGEPLFVMIEDKTTANDASPVQESDWLD